MKLPEHVAIIMDGNGRWAKKRNLPRVMGHRSGAKAADAICEACARKGIKALTLYSFSTENWKRPKQEVDGLMDLIEDGIRRSVGKMTDNNIRFNMIGRLEELPDPLRETIADTKQRTAANTGMVLTFALNYGGRQEIVDAVRSLCAEKAGSSSAITESDLEERLYTSGLPDPDLVIRTSGEMRVSNFLLWQAAYAEYYITDTLWPDFDETELEKALNDYAKRERRFGE